MLLRLVLDDDQDQADLVEAWLNKRSSRDPAYISALVVCELAWVLATTQHFSRARIVAVLSALLSMSVLRVERAELVQRAIERYLHSAADFGDCWIAETGLDEGCEYTVTFDKAAAKLPGMRLLR